MISQKFLSSALIYTLVGSLPLVSGLILLPFYISQLNEINFGILTLYIAITLFFQGIILFATEHKTAVDYFQHPNGSLQQKQVLSTNLIWGVAFAVLFALLAIGWSVSAGKDVLERNDLQLHPWLWMCIVTALGNAMFKQYTSFLIFGGRITEFVIVNTINFVATISISLWGLYYFGDSIQGPMLGRFSSGLIILLMAVLHFLTRIGIRFKAGEGKLILMFVWPMLLYIAFSWVSSYIDRFIIKHYLDTESVGIFDFAVKCTMGIEFILAGLVNVVYPKIYELFKKSDSMPENEFNRVQNLYYNGMTGGVFAAVLFTLIVVPLLAPVFIHKVNYLNALAFLPVLSISFLFRIVFHFYYAPIVFTKKTYWLPINLAIASVIQIVFSVWLTAWLGLTGTVLSFVLAKLLTSLIFWMFSQRVMNIRFMFQQQLIFPLVVSVISLVFYALGYTSYQHTLLQCLLHTLVFVFFFRKEIGEVRIVKRVLGKNR
jgi:O-antigen/teichoic acid export membrane protein